ncbi:MAG TPA: hypothetical protein DCP90_00105 [Clostridiales bacterium]|nr:MAG: hypothetical protein A2Y22_02580 [Clostridiales bacterium GWD2_32_59]HAN08997.1 hypothetical protein [Clostridiales bacterium]
MRSDTIALSSIFIEDGVFKKIVATKNYAEYLKCEVTGSSTNLVVSPGNKTYEELLEDGDIIASSFSSFTPNGVTGAFSGEIRNAKLYTGGQYIPIKGGSVTGVMTEAMKEVYFSKEMLQTGKYFGPKYIKVCNVDVTGE